MKNKLLSSILIPMVILIWGIIIFKIIKHINNSEVPTLATYSFTKTSSHETTKDTLTLILNYRDPFLNGIARGTTISEGNNNLTGDKSVLFTPAKPLAKFPDIKYSGMVINSKNKQKTGLLKIENKDFLVKDGELAGRVKVFKLFTDSVIVVSNREKRTFYKN